MTFDETKNKLLLQKKQLYKNKLNYIQLLTNTTEEIDKISLQIEKNCLTYFGKHDYIIEQETGMYGETFHICSRCNHMH